MLVEVFTYISFVIVLFADADQHRTISLLGLLGNLIPDTASVHGCLIAIHFAMSCCSWVRPQSSFCEKSNVCKMHAAFTRFIDFTSISLRPARTDALFQRDDQ